jgi:hypothetical protein
VEQIASFALGLAAGLLTPVMQRRLRRVASWFRERKSSHLASLDPSGLGFFTLNQWSYRRPLRPEDIVQTVVPHNAGTNQTWCDERTLRSIRLALDDEGGPACTLVDLEVDHRESERGKKLRLTFSPSLYGDFVAVHDYFAARPSAVAEVRRRLEREPTQRLVREAPASIVAVNATVTSSDGLVIALQRSSAVRKWQNEWGLGGYETMLLPTERPGEGKDFFGATQRCLREEIGLEPGKDYGDIIVSWMGYWISSALLHVITHARSTLTAAEIVGRIGECDSSFETANVLWLPDSKASLSRLIKNHPTDAAGRTWIATAPLAAQQYRRCRSLLD